MYTSSTNGAKTSEVTLNEYDYRITIVRSSGIEPYQFKELLRHSICGTAFYIASLFDINIFINYTIIDDAIVFIKDRK